MSQFTAIITDKIGLHARPASLVTKVASTFISDIEIICGDKKGNLKSIMNILSMQIKKGDKIKIIAIGDDAEAAIKGVKEEMIKTALIEK